MVCEGLVKDMHTGLIQQKYTEQESRLKSLVSEMATSKAHYERRIGELNGTQSDLTDQLQAAQVLYLYIAYINTCVGYFSD